MESCTKPRIKDRILNGKIGTDTTRSTWAMTKVFENEFWVYYLNEYLLYLDEAKSGK